MNSNRYTRQSVLEGKIIRVQEFGGPWSLLKTDLVENYMRFFNTALKKQRVERVYIDGFAGSGAFRYVPEDAPAQSLFGPVDDTLNVHRGSAYRALYMRPAFDRIIFIEESSDNVAALRTLIETSKHPAAIVQEGDANKLLRRICRPDAWLHSRGVIFLDPFGMNVDWNTLRLIANTRALDVWFLFALAGTVRNLPRLASRLDAGKKAAVTRVLGTEDWYDEFYETIPNSSFFSSAPIVRRKASVDDIEKYVGNRLRTIFPFVAAPKRLRSGGKSLFSLFFAVSNPHPKAIDLASRAALHLLK